MADRLHGRVSGSVANVPRRRANHRVCLLWAAVSAGIGLLAAGCTSDDPNLTGIGLHEAAIDSVLIPLTVEELVTFGNLTVDDSEQPFDKQEVLYFGRQGTERSSMLVRYDLANLPNAEYPDSLFSALYIEKVELLLYMLKYYVNFVHPNDPDTLHLQKTYQVHELTDTLDVSLYPGPEPAFDPFFVNQAPFDLEPVGEVTLEMSEGKFLEWYEAGGHPGIIIREGSTGQEVDGFVGFSAADFDTLTHARELPTLASGTLPFPVLRITFDPELDVPKLRMIPRDDVSTLDTLDPVPQNFANGVVVRTHLRSYPYLRFELAKLPANVIINRAVVRVVNDTLQSYGITESLVLSRVPESFAAGGDRQVALIDFRASAEAVTARTNLDPFGGEDAADVILEFNVTRDLQRHQNGTPFAPLTYAISAAENFHSASFNTTPTPPDFYLIRFRFYGSGDPEPEHRPVLKIFYTRDNEVTGGGG